MKDLDFGKDFCPFNNFAPEKFVWQVQVCLTNQHLFLKPIIIVIFFIILVHLENGFVSMVSV